MTAPELEPFADRRLRLAAALGDAIAVVPGAQNGRRAGVEGAVATYGADAAYPIDLLDEKLREYLIGRRALCYRLGNAAFDGRITRLLAELRLARARGLQVPVAVEDPAPLLAELRLRRSARSGAGSSTARSEEHTSELQ